MKKKTPDRYTLEKLIEKLTNLYLEKEETLNHPKAFYSLALEIKKLKEKLERLKVAKVGIIRPKRKDEK